MYVCHENVVILPSDKFDRCCQMNDAIITPFLEAIINFSTR